MYVSNFRALAIIAKRLFWKNSFKFVSALSGGLFLFVKSASVFSLDPRIINDRRLVCWLLEIYSSKLTM